MRQRKQVQKQADPLDEIAPQAKELLDRVVELRSLAPILAEAEQVSRDTGSRMRVLSAEVSDILRGMLPTEPAAPTRMPVERTEVPLPAPIVPDEGYDTPPDDEEVTLDGYEAPLKARTDLSERTVRACNNAGYLTVGKVVEFAASRQPFSSIPGVGPAENRELNRLIQPWREMMPTIRAKLGM